MFSFSGAGHKKRWSNQLCKANWVTIITFKEISMTSPSMQAESHIALSRGSETQHWAEGVKPSSAAALETHKWTESVD